MLVTLPTGMPRDGDRIARLQGGGLQELARCNAGNRCRPRWTISIAPTMHADHRHGDPEPRCCSSPAGACGAAVSKSSQPLAMFLHRGVYMALFPGVAALTMIGTTSLRPGKNPVAFRSQA